MPISIKAPEPTRLGEPWSWNVPQLLERLTPDEQQVVMGRLRAIGAIAPDVQSWPSA